MRLERVTTVIAVLVASGVSLAAEPSCLPEGVPPVTSAAIVRAVEGDSSQSTIALTMPRDTWRLDKRAHIGGGHYVRADQGDDVTVIFTGEWLLQTDSNRSKWGSYFVGDAIWLAAIRNIASTSKCGP
jgi:hypothetical protein